jgi:hypothetical protein
METRTKLTDGLTKTINAAGSALIAVYDTGAGLLSCTVSKVLGCERSQLNATIKEYESRILELYVEIGRECARFTDPVEAFAAEQVQSLITQLKELQGVVAASLSRLDEIAQEKIAAKIAKKVEKPPTEKRESLLARALARASARAAGEKAISCGAFSNMSDKEIFRRVAKYLANEETELQLLLIKGLEKTGSKAEVPALVDALSDGDARIRNAALGALAYIRDESVVNRVVQLLSDDNVEVRARALDCLKSITGLESEFDIHAEGVALSEWVELVNRSLESWFESIEEAPLEPVYGTSADDACDQDNCACHSGTTADAAAGETEAVQDQAVDTVEQDHAEEGEQDESTPVWKRKKLKKIG